MKQIASSEKNMRTIGRNFGRSLKGGEVVELIGDVGAGKTTFVKGLAGGLGVKEAVQSPSFTLFARYNGSSGRSLHHFDFYRLEDPGLVAYDLAESLSEPGAVTVVEWGGTVAHVLPGSRTVIRFTPEDETSRKLTIKSTSS